MLRAFFIYLSKAEWAKRLVTNWSFAWRFARRFIAGEKLEDAINVVRELNLRGINATLDHLGEYTTKKADAVRAAQDIIEILDAIEAAQVRSGVSLKLSQIGLELDEELCAEGLRNILARARQYGNFVRIDMEDSSTVDATLRIYQQMRNEYEFDNVGVVIQAYLYRSEADIQELLRSETKVRLCKGAYKEPPEIAFPEKQDVDANYDKLSRMILDATEGHRLSPPSLDGRIPPLPALATHDEKRIEFAKVYARQLQLDNNALEFQMLYGIRRDLQYQLIQDGYSVRVYVPYGTQWYPYFMRRLAERPANVWFFFSNIFRE